MLQGRKKLAILMGCGVLIAFVSMPKVAFAGGFQLMEENVTNLGNAFAGTGAEAADASTEFYNPAGMTLLDNPQFVVGGTLIDVGLTSDVTSASSTTSINLGPLGTTTTTSNITGNSSTNPGGIVAIPEFHYVYPYNHYWAIGFGVTTPYGLSVDYPQESLNRFIATKSFVGTVNFGPTVALQLLTPLSVGGGLDVQYIDATLNQMVLPFLTDLQGDPFTNEGDDWAVGWHAGLLYQFTCDTRVGASYHSQMHYTVNGDSTITTSSGAETGTFTSDVTLPDYADLSFYHDFNTKWAVLASLDYTHWSVLQNITANFAGNIANSVQETNIPLLFEDTYRVSLGLNYRPIRRLLLRTGVAYDQSPVKNSQTRTFRIPDSDRYWVGLGGQYVINKKFTLDAGYTHLFTNNPYGINSTITINGTLPGPGGVAIPFTDTETAVGSFDGVLTNSVFS
ncbi:MAG: outer membrane protein transport protein [Coxiellaceae bacterium]|nr:MAG: outer membrane protein transport protein [Coxiellaceae bacterium]